VAAAFLLVVVGCSLQIGGLKPRHSCFRMPNNANPTVPPSLHPHTPTVVLSMPLLALQLFSQNVGRQPGTTDPVFFDDLASTPKALDASALVTQ
jgi:hypothetical protein